MTLEIPGLNILKKYNYTIISNQDLKTIVETSGIISHFDRQKLFNLCWKKDIEYNNRYMFDMILCK